MANMQTTTTNIFTTWKRRRICFCECCTDNLLLILLSVLDVDCNKRKMFSKASMGPEISTFHFLVTGSLFSYNYMHCCSSKMREKVSVSLFHSSWLFTQITLSSQLKSFWTQWLSRRVALFKWGASPHEKLAVSRQHFGWNLKDNHLFLVVVNVFVPPVVGSARRFVPPQFESHPSVGKSYDGQRNKIFHGYQTHTAKYPEKCALFYVKSFCNVWS